MNEAKVRDGEQEWEQKLSTFYLLFNSVLLNQSNAVNLNVGDKSD